MACPALDLAQLVAELDQQPPEALLLVGREDEDARHVVLLSGLLLLGEVAHDVEPTLVPLRHHVEEEGVGVVVEGLVVEEELGEQAKVLCVDLVHAAVDFEEGDGLLAVDLVAGWVGEVAFLLESGLG